MSAFGVAFIGNIWALAMFGIGLLLRQCSVPLFNVDVNTMYVPHGFMIGAGIVALFQVAFIIFRKKKPITTSAGVEEAAYTVGDKQTSRTLGLGFIAYLVVALIAAMHSGWFPAFAIALITLIIGMMIGFPPVALALLVGFSAATGPAFADMGYDLKTGYILRGNGADAHAELEGRKQQYIAGLIAFGVALITVAFSYNSFFSQGLIPPVDKVYASTIEAGTSPEVAKQLLMWAIPGAILQLVGGSSRQVGVMFATGLLILNPNAGWAVLGGILIRMIVLKLKGKEAESTLSILAAGFIAGDAIYSFFSSVVKFAKK